MPRPRSVISPKLPSRAKPKAVKTDGTEWHPFPGRAFRLRPTSPGPWGEIEPPTYGDDEEDLEAQAVQLRAEGIECMVEISIRAAWRVRSVHD